MSDATMATERPLVALEAAVQAGRADVFVDESNRIDWSQMTADECREAVRLALAVGAHLRARELAALGSERFPRSLDLERMSRVLAPPRVTLAPTRDPEAVQKNRQWLETHAAPYRGNWVALRGGELVASGETLEELTTSVRLTREILVTRVP